MFLTDNTQLNKPVQQLCVETSTTLSTAGQLYNDTLKSFNFILRVEIRKKYFLFVFKYGRCVQTAEL